MSKKIYKENYFQHDQYARRDPKIKDMLAHFRCENEELAKSAVCVFWWIVEDMHTDDYPINKLRAFADDYRCSEDFLKSILEDFGLFRIEGENYVSDRVLRNLKEQEEKKEKARKSAERRWNGKGKKENGPEAPQEKKEVTPEYNEELVMSIIHIYNKEFKVSRIVSKANKDLIFKIHTENNLNLEIWEKVFSNAKRGWDIGEKKNVKPNLPLILAKWDSFASNDYFLAPDREEIARQAKIKEDAARAERQQQDEINRTESEEREQNFLNVCDKETALEFLEKYIHIKNPELIRRNSDFKTFRNEYGITVEEFLDYIN